MINLNKCIIGEHKRDFLKKQHKHTNLTDPNFLNGIFIFLDEPVSCTFWGYKPINGFLIVVSNY